VQILEPTIANYCINSGIGTVVFGWNQGLKQKSNMGKRSNQNFVQLPTAKLKERLKVVLAEIGVNFVETEESYTSRASFLDGDEIPVFGHKPEHWKASGRRTTTKLYQTAKGWIINADIIGAKNAGLKAIWKSDRFWSQSKEADATINSLDKIPTTLKKWQKDRKL